MKNSDKEIYSTRFTLLYPLVPIVLILFGNVDWLFEKNNDKETTILISMLALFYWGMVFIISAINLIHIHINQKIGELQDKDKN